MIMKDTIDSQESKNKKPQSLKRRFDNNPLADARDMVPIVYPEKMKVFPCNETAGVEKQKQVKKEAMLGSLAQSLKT